MTNPKQAWVITMRRPVTARDERVVGVLPGRRGRREVIHHIVHLHDHLLYTVEEQVWWPNDSTHPYGRRAPNRPDLVHTNFFGPGAHDDDRSPDQRSWGCEIGQSLLLTAHLAFDVHTVGSSEDDDLELVWTLVAADGSTETRRCDATRAVLEAPRRAARTHRQRQGASRDA